jgi:hypothetical protein
MLTAVATEKKTISDTEDCQLTTLVNSTSTAPLIGLPPTGTKFCYTSNILLVGRQCHSALLQLYFNSSVVDHRSLVVGGSTEHNKRVVGLWEISLQKDYFHQCSFYILSPALNTSIPPDHKSPICCLQPPHRCLLSWQRVGQHIWQTCEPVHGRPIILRPGMVSDSPGGCSPSNRSDCPGHVEACGLLLSLAITILPSPQSYS